jgi:hypothetical protein
MSLAIEVNEVKRIIVAITLFMKVLKYFKDFLIVMDKFMELYVIEEKYNLYRPRISVEIELGE